MNISLPSLKYIKWLLIIIAVVVSSVFALSIVGKLFIKEVVQEVAIKDEKEEAAGINIGEKATFWELQDLLGNTIALSDFLGKPLVLTFWTTWNSMSADQIKIFDEYLSENKETIFKIITINNQEDKSIVENFIRRGGYKVKVLLDETGKVGENYKVRTLPATYFLDREGTIRDIFMGVLSEEMLVEKVEAIIR